MYRNKYEKKVNDWTLKKEKLLRYWQEECKLYNWLYRQNVEWYQKTNKYMSISSILLSAITGTTLINQTNNGDSTTDSTLFIVFGLVSIISTFVQSVKEFMDFNGKISSNMLTARQNSSIVIDIEEQLNLSRIERINGKEFMKHIKTRKNEIIQNGPMVPKSSWKKLRDSIRRKEGLNFFNQNLFQNYLDQNIDINKIDFNLDNQSSGSSNGDNNFQLPITPSINNKTPQQPQPQPQPQTQPQPQHQPIYNQSQPIQPSPTNSISNKLYGDVIINDTIGDMLDILDDSIATNIILDKDKIDVLNANNINNINNINNDSLNNTRLSDLQYRNRSLSVNTLTGSEDEFLEDIQNNNICIHELRRKINTDEESNAHKFTGIRLSNYIPNFIKKKKSGDECVNLDGIIINDIPLKQPTKKDKIKQKQKEKAELNHMLKYRISTI